MADIKETKKETTKWVTYAEIGKSEVVAVKVIDGVKKYEIKL